MPNRTERCTASGVEISMCECILHRKQERGRYAHKVPRARVAKRCERCGLARDSVCKRPFPENVKEPRLCADCFEARTRETAERAAQRGLHGEFDWSRVRAERRSA